MNFYQMLALIQQQYPQLMPILLKPGVFAVVAQSIQENWPATRLTSALEATPYYQQTNQTTRQWDILAATDPATAAQKGEATSRTVKDLAGQLGAELPGDQMFMLTAVANQEGWDQNRIRYELLLRSEHNGQTNIAFGGDLAKTAAAVKGLSDSYGVPLSDNGTIGWAQHLLSGQIDIDAVQGYMIEQAKSLYPGLTAALSRGVTVAQYADPYKQLAVQELGINPADFALSDPKWSAPLSQIDPKTGESTPLNLADWQTKLRTDSTYGYDGSQAARTQVGQLATTIEQKFGAA